MAIGLPGGLTVPTGMPSLPADDWRVVANVSRMKADGMPLHRATGKTILAVRFFRFREVIKQAVDDPEDHAECQRPREIVNLKTGYEFVYQ